MLRGFGAFQVDFAVQRRFRFTERVNVLFRGDFFNIFNHPNFAVPNGNLASGSTFGLSTFDFNGPRITQLALRFDF